MTVRADSFVLWSNRSRLLRSLQIVSPVYLIGLTKFTTATTGKKALYISLFLVSALVSKFATATNTKQFVIAIPFLGFPLVSCVVS